MQETAFTIRQARIEELPALREIERAAGKLFSEIGLDNVANAGPLPLDFLKARQEAGMVWVLTDADDQPAGFAAASEIDDTLYLEELDIHPAHGRRGFGKRLIETLCVCRQMATRAVCEHWFGKRLIETLCVWAEERGYPAVTLLTFRDVPWNAPFYSRIGFRIVEEGEIGPGLKALLDHSIQVWFPLARVCMRRDLRDTARQGD